jgi:hypothetical protein
VAHGRKLELKQPVVAAQVVVRLRAQAVELVLELVLVLVLVLVLEQRLVEQRQEALLRLVRRLLRVQPQPVWL